MPGRAGVVLWRACLRLRRRAAACSRIAGVRCAAGVVTAGAPHGSYFPSTEKKYGRPINDWLDLIRGAELIKHKALVDWLKAGYGLGHGHATALVGYALAQPNANYPGSQPQHPAHMPASHQPAR